MKKRFLKDLEVSEIGMGYMGFSHGYGKVPEEAYAITAIQKAYNFGCTFFDTTESYGKEQFYAGHNEELVGKAIKPFRKNVVLATKLHLSTEEFQENSNLYYVMRKHLENSMKHLQTDYIDLYYLHRINEMISLEDIAIVMGQFIKEGLIRGWGMSQISLETLKKANDITVK